MSVGGDKEVRSVQTEVAQRGSMAERSRQRDSQFEGPEVHPCLLWWGNNTWGPVAGADVPGEVTGRSWRAWWAQETLGFDPE